MFYEERETILTTFSLLKINLWNQVEHMILKKQNYTIQYSNGKYSLLSISLSSFFSDYICISVSQSLSLVELIFLCSLSFWKSILFCDSIFLLFSLSLCLWFQQRHVGKPHSCEKAQIRAFKHPNARTRSSWMSTLSQIFHILYVD